MISVNGHFHVAETAIYGYKYKDDVFMNVDKYFRQTKMDITFNVVHRCSDSVQFEFDGMIGIAPRAYTSSNPGNLGNDVGFLQ